MATINLKVTDIKRIRTPYDGTGENAEQYVTAGRTYIAAVKLQDIPAELKDWRQLNVRDPQMTSGVAKAIAASLRDDPEAFFFKNRGITLVVDDIGLGDKARNNDVQLVLSNPEYNGLLDGGHTYAAIRTYVEELRSEGNGKIDELDGHVKVELIVGLKNKEDVVAIVEARNTSTQVKIESLEELAGHFEVIKKALKGQPYANRIAYKETEFADDGSKKDIDIKELLSYIVCFDTELYPFDSKSQPTVAYSSKAAVIKHFKDDANRARLEKYIDLLPDILQLRDRIYAELPEVYNHSVGGAFGRLTGVGKVKRPITLPFSEDESEYQIPSAFIYPVLAAFRALVKIENGKAVWQESPRKVWNAQKVHLAESIGEEAKKLQNPNKMGKQKSLWEQCYRDLLIAQLTAKK